MMLTSQQFLYLIIVNFFNLFTPVPVSLFWFGWTIIFVRPSSLTIGNWKAQGNKIMGILNLGLYQPIRSVLHFTYLSKKYNNNWKMSCYFFIQNKIMLRLRYLFTRIVWCIAHPQKHHGSWQTGNRPDRWKWKKKKWSEKVA